jgi:hypothetical protein
MRWLRLAPIASILLAGGCMTYLPVGALDPKPTIELSRGARPLRIALEAVPDSFSVPYNETSPHAAVSDWRRSIANAFHNGLSGFYRVRADAPEGGAATIEVLETSVGFRSAGRFASRGSLRFRVRLIDAAGCEIGHSFGEVSSGGGVSVGDPATSGFVLDYGPPLRELLERMVEQVARDCLLPLERQAPR